MEPNNSGFSQVRRIDTNRRQLPLLSLLLIASLIALAVWFFRGGSFRLYASLFFGLYYLTGQVWVSVIFLGIVQNLAFLPLHFVGLRLSASLKDFEAVLDKENNENTQYFLFKEKVKTGDWTVTFYIFNFIVHAIAFLSAGRIFLIDFYTKPLDPRLIYRFIPYPAYPLRGTDFRFPFFKVTQTTSLDWSLILKIWLIILLVFVVPRLLWRLIRWIFWRNQKILSLRINYNRLLLWIGGFIGTVFFVSLYLFRHLPTSLEFILLTADLTRQNSTMNLITAIGTFITALHAGYVRFNLAAAEGRKKQLPPEIIDQVYRVSMRQTFRNSLFLGIGAFLITNQIPCAFELSVATFEVLYIISPYTFDRFLKGASPKPAAEPYTEQSPPQTPPTPGQA